MKHRAQPTRRTLLGLAVSAPVAFAAMSAAAAETCLDPDNLSDAELSLRASLKFQEKAAVPARACAKCAFYKGETAPASCGQCQLLHGPVLGQSSCNSWAPKP